VSDKKSRSAGPNAQSLYLFLVQTRVILDHDHTRKVSTLPFDLPHPLLFHIQENSSTRLPDRTREPPRRMMVLIDTHSNEENSAITITREYKRKGSALYLRLLCLRFVESDWRDSSVPHRSMTKRRAMSVIDENVRPRRVIL
jgi:hypothetical protein